MELSALPQENKDVRVITHEIVREAVKDYELYSEVTRVLLVGTHEQVLALNARDTELNGYIPELYIVDGILMYKDILLIPKSLREEILHSLHSGHQGVTGMQG